MKRIMLIGLVILVSLSLTGCVSTVTNLAGGKSKGDPNFNSEKAITMFKDTLKMGTNLTYDSLIKVSKALKNKEWILTLESSKKDALKSIDNNDPDAYKVADEGASNIVGEINKLNLSKEIAGKEAEQHLNNGCLDVGLALMMDKKSIDFGKILIEKLPGEIKSNPMNAGKFKSILNFARPVVTQLPTQINNIATFASSIGKYASMKGLPEPTIEQESSRMDEACEEVGCDDSNKSDYISDN